MSQTVATAKDDVGLRGHGQDRHPAGLYILFATEMWERFGFYTAAAIMTLYLQRGRVRLDQDAGDQALVELPDVRLCHPADRRLAGRPVPRLSPLGAHRRGCSSSPATRCSGMGSIATFYIALAPDLRRQRLLQAEHLDDGRQPLPGRQPAEGLGLQHLLHGDQHRRLLAPVVAEGALAAPRRSRGARDGQEGRSRSRPEQAASLRAGFLTAFYAAAAGMTLGTVIFAVFYRKLAAAERRHVPLEAADRRGRRRHRGPPAGRAETLGDRPGARMDPDHGAPGHLRDRDRLLDGVPPERQHDDLLGRREHRLERLGRRLQSRSIRSGSSSSRCPLVGVWNWLQPVGVSSRRRRSKMALGMLLTSLAFLILFVAAKSGGDQTFVTDAQGQFVLD